MEIRSRFADSAVQFHRGSRQGCASITLQQQIFCTIACLTPVEDTHTGGWFVLAMTPHGGVIGNTIKSISSRHGQIPSNGGSRQPIAAIRSRSYLRLHLATQVNRHGGNQAGMPAPLSRAARILSSGAGKYPKGDTAASCMYAFGMARTNIVRTRRPSTREQPGERDDALVMPAGHVYCRNHVTTCRRVVLPKMQSVNKENISRAGKASAAQPANHRGPALFLHYCRSHRTVAVW